MTDRKITPATDEEIEQIRAEIADLPSPEDWAHFDHTASKLIARIEAERAENDKLRARVAELEAEKAAWKESVAGKYRTNSMCGETKTRSEVARRAGREEGEDRG